MPRPLRLFDNPKEIHFVTNRCLQERFFLTPSKETDALILSCLGRALDRHPVTLYSFVFMSNHFHLLVKASHHNLSSFMRVFQSTLAVKLNLRLDRHGKFWARRFSQEPVLDTTSTLERYAYIANNPGAADLVLTPGEWPGLLSHKTLGANEILEGTWFDSAEAARLKRQARDRGEAVNADAGNRSQPITLTMLPCLEGQSREEAVKTLNDAVESRRKEVDAGRPARMRERHNRNKRRRKHEKRKYKGTVAGRDAVLRKNPLSRPQRPKRSPRPLCHASSKQKRRDYKEHYDGCASLYIQAAVKWRAKPYARVVWPVGMFRPGCIQPVLSAREAG